MKNIFAGVCLLLLTGNNCIAGITEEKLISSTKKVEKVWSKIFKSGPIILATEWPTNSLRNQETNKRIELFTAYKYIFHEVTSDIIKTNSLKYPYEMIIIISVEKRNNGDSPRAMKYGECEGQFTASICARGFESREIALKNIEESDFPKSLLGVTALEYHYRFDKQNNRWELYSYADSAESVFLNVCLKKYYPEKFNYVTIIPIK